MKAEELYEDAESDDFYRVQLMLIENDRTDDALRNTWLPRHLYERIGLERW